MNRDQMCHLLVCSLVIACRLERPLYEQDPAEVGRIGGSNKKARSCRRFTATCASHSGYRVSASFKTSPIRTLVSPGAQQSINK